MREFPELIATWPEVTGEQNDALVHAIESINKLSALDERLVGYADSFMTILMHFYPAGANRFHVNPKPLIIPQKWFDDEDEFDAELMSPRVN